MSLDKINKWYETELESLVLELKNKLAIAKTLRDKEYSIDNFKARTKDLRKLYYKKTSDEIKKETLEDIKNIKGEGRENRLKKEEASKNYEEEILESRREIERLDAEARIQTKKLEIQLIAQTKKEKRKNIAEMKTLKLRIIKGKLKNRINLLNRKYVEPKKKYLELKQKKLNDILFPIIEKLKEYVKLLK